MRTLKEFLNEAKMKSRVIPTHLANGKPNPEHPKYAEHAATYVAKPRAPSIIPSKVTDHEKVTAGDYSDALSNIPDEDSSDAVQRIAKKHNISYDAAHKGLSKIAGRDYHDEHEDAAEEYNKTH